MAPSSIEAIPITAIERALTMTERRRHLACGCVLGYERCFKYRPGLHMDQEKALAEYQKLADADGENAPVKGERP